MAEASRSLSTEATEATQTTGPTEPLEPVDPVFRRRYLKRAAGQLPGHSATVLDAIAAEHYRFGRCRRPGEILVRVRALDDEHSAVEIVTADVSYLVDSVRSELRVSGYPAENVLHPQLIVTRDAAGVLQRVEDVADTAEVPPGAGAESWMFVEVPAVARADEKELTASVGRILGDVHHAVHDAPQLYELVRTLARRLGDDPGPFDRDTSTEAGDLLRWLADGNFMFLGHVAYTANELTFSASGSGPSADPQAGGVLRGRASISARELLPAFRSGAPVVIFKSALTSTVLRSARLDCVTVNAPAVHVPGEPDEPARVHVFLGLFTESDSSAVSRVPVLRRRIRYVLAQAGVRADSYTGRQLVAALRTLPRDELLEADSADLIKLAQLVSSRAERGGVGVFSRLHLNNDFISVLVYLPIDRLGADTVAQVRQIVGQNWPGSLITRESSLSDLGLARLHYLITLRPGEPVPTPDPDQVEARIAEITRGWADDLTDLLYLAVGDAEGDRLVKRYENAFPEAYKEDFDADVAVRDIARLEALPEVDGLSFEMYIPRADDDAQRRLKVFRTGSHISLARALPMFGYLGVEVLDERPYELDRRDGSSAWIYDFGLALPAGVELDDPSDLLEALRRLWRGDAEQDGFNALVLRAGLTWRQVTVLRAYAKYLRQAGTPFSQGYIEQTLVDFPAIARGIVELFELRFDPARQVANGNADDVQAEHQAVLDALGDVASLDQDRILRYLCGLVQATLRTNVFRRDRLIGADPPVSIAATKELISQRAEPVGSQTVSAEGAEPVRAALAFKLDPQLIEGLPYPRPRFEIWVYSPRVEGVHLRFGLVARGGLRWSDRREDFRTEVLGLVKAQMVKNAVIVPVGAKGGFVVKQPPADLSDRESALREGIACYRTFVSSLLDVTDNYAAGGASTINTATAVAAGAQKIEPPTDVVRYDGDDPYLVVAADKGTATFSDIANAISVRRGFWLGDAFASGGSVGYDHKAMGITARGAWESVKYHFRERGLDTQTEDFTVVGVGDMSGDVFGNGMLLSARIRLVAAFDHRHIFLDPTPDASASFAERARLFALPRSSWADYDAHAISAGGGVYPRTLKAIPISPQVRTALDLPSGTTSMAPAQLMHAILTAPVDLLFNGGIGTYVKASGESHASVGDKANDALRADASQLRCRVIGEGGNLGCTQLGRVEFARGTAAYGPGGINTDAIDNSAGVDTSDHEVNIKILLDRQVAAGALTTAQRNELLATTTDEVAADVLVDNYQQNVLLGLERRLAGPMVGVYGRLIRELERGRPRAVASALPGSASPGNGALSNGRLDRALEFLPSDKELATRALAGEGLVSPELAVVAAYVKITATVELEASDLADEPYFHRALTGYFPASIARLDGGREDRATKERGPERLESLASHPLSREIITTVVVNDMVNRAGTTFLFRAMEESGADAAQVARAYTVSRQVFDLEELWQELAALDNKVPVDAQHAAYFAVRRMVDRVTRWLLDVRYPISDLSAEIERFAAVVAQLSPALPELLGANELVTLRADVDALGVLGLPAELALQVGSLLAAFSLLDVVEIAEISGRPAREVAELHFALSERFSIDPMLTAITALPRADHWSALARAALRHDVYAALAAITQAVLRSTDAELPATQRLRRWEAANAERVTRTLAIVADALAVELPDLATLSVALRVMRGLPS